MPLDLDAMSQIGGYSRLLDFSVADQIDMVDNSILYRILDICIGGFVWII